MKRIYDITVLNEAYLARLGRSLARKVKGSKNFLKTKHKLAKCHEIISENQVIVTENLQAKNMMQNHKLASSISDASWYELTRQLAYKAEWDGRTYIKIDTFYASIQLCNVCVYQNRNTKSLSIRKWQCPNCNTMHDRDVNASRNILKEGLRLMA